MTVLYYLFLNKIRENIRIIKRMKSAAFVLVISFLFLGYQFYVNMWSGIAGNGYNAALFKAIILVITMFSAGKYISAKPNIIMEPITLHILQNTDNFKGYYAYKLFIILIKNIVFATILSILTYGGMFEAMIFLSFLTILCSKDFTKWILYHKKNKVLSGVVCIITILLGISCTITIRIMLYGFSIISVLSYFYCMIGLTWNPAYYKAMNYAYEIHLAQISGDTEALSKYVENNNNTMLQSSRRYVRHPIVWKSLLSILRLDIKFLLFAVAFFIACFFVRITNFTEGIPMLELDLAKQMLLLISIYFLLQMIIQLFVREFEKLMNNHISGLFLPFDVTELIKQYAIVPTVLLIVTIIIMGLLLRSNVIYVIGEVIVVSFLNLFQIFMVAKNKKLLMKITPIINLIFFSSCYLLIL